MNEIIINILNKNKADGILMISPINRFWYMGFKSSLGYLIINKKAEVIFITDSRYFLMAKNATKNTNIKIWSITAEKSLTTLLKEAKEELEIETVLLEEEYLNIAEYNYVKGIFDNNKTFKSRTMREIKTKEQIIELQKAADIIVDVVKWLWTFIKPGYSEKEIAKMICIKILELGAEGNSFDPIVAAGLNGASPHHQPSDYKIQDGDMVTVDLGCVYKNYTSDMTRTFVVGNKCNQPKVLDIYQTVLNSQLKGVEKATVGITGKELDKVCRDLIDSTEYKGLFAHGTGHGVGIEVHELPNVNLNNNAPLVNNNVVTIEPGIYLENVGGVRIEDTIIINENKAIVLTRNCPKELLYIYNK